MPKSKRRKPKNTGPTPAKLPEQRIVLTDSKKPAPEGPEPDSVMMGYIHPGDVRGEFATSMFVTALAVPQVMGLVARQSGPRISSSRCLLVDEFLATRFEWLLMVDADMFWTPEDVHYVLQSADRKERPIMGGLCFADQVGNLFPTIYALGEDGSYHVALEYPKDTVLPVDGTGAAFLLVHRDVYTAVRAANADHPHPVFADTIVNGAERGEDLTFCARAKELGYPIYVDTRAKIGHVKQRYLTEPEYDAAKDRSHYIITGTGRCGTGYMSTFMTHLHQATGHELVFNPETIARGQGQPPPWQYMRGDASWLAAPFIPTMDIPVMHLVRNHLDVVKSMMGIDFFGGNIPDHQPYLDFAALALGRKYPQTYDTAEVLARTVDFVLSWNELIEKSGTTKYARVRLEDFSSDAMYAREAVGFLLGDNPDRTKIQGKIDTIEQDINTRPRTSHNADELTWDDIPELHEQAKRYGYEVA